MKFTHLIPPGPVQDRLRRLCTRLSEGKKSKWKGTGAAGQVVECLSIDECAEVFAAFIVLQLDIALLRFDPAYKTPMPCYSPGVFVYDRSALLTAPLVDRVIRQVVELGVRAGFAASHVKTLVLRQTSALFVATAYFNCWWVGPVLQSYSGALKQAVEQSVLSKAADGVVTPHSRRQRQDAAATIVGEGALGFRALLRCAFDFAKANGELPFFRTHRWAASLGLEAVVDKRGHAGYLERIVCLAIGAPRKSSAAAKKPTSGAVTFAASSGTPVRGTALSGRSLLRGGIYHKACSELGEAILSRVTQARGVLGGVDLCANPHTFSVLPCTIRSVEHTGEHTFAESLKAMAALLSTKAMLLPRTLVRQQYASKLIERQAPLTPTPGSDEDAEKLSKKQGSNIFLKYCGLRAEQLPTIHCRAMAMLPDALENHMNFMEGIDHRHAERWPALRAVTLMRDGQEITGYLDSLIAEAEARHGSPEPENRPGAGGGGAGGVGGDSRPTGDGASAHVGARGFFWHVLAVAVGRNATSCHH